MEEPILLKVGKALDNDVVLNIPFISEYHLEVFQDVEGNVFMTDLNSSNGTFVNGKRLVGFIMLRPKDEVFLGSGFRFQWEQLLLSSKKSKIQDLNKDKIKIEPKKYVDAYEKTEPKQAVNQQVQVSDLPFYKEHLDLILIYGSILIIILFWYLNA
jgi:hypothetical protein